MEPTFLYEHDEDGRDLWWSHTCNFADLVRDPTGGTFRHVTRLPLDAETGWVVQQAEPLTVTPSILCGSCGEHGFITDGKWVPA